MPVAYVYMMSNKSHRLYAGVAVNLPKRVMQHKQKTYPNGFTARYNFDRLVWFEAVASLAAPLLVASVRSSHGEGTGKWALIQEKNPNWLDLSETWTQLLRIE